MDFSLLPPRFSVCFWLVLAPKITLSKPLFRAVSVFTSGLLLRSRVVSLLPLRVTVVSFVFLLKSTEASTPTFLELLRSTFVSSVLASRLIVVKSLAPMFRFVRAVSLLRSTAVRLFWCRSSSVRVEAPSRLMAVIPSVISVASVAYFVKAWK